MSRRMDISPLFLSGGWSFFPEQLANASDFALSTLAIIAFPGKIRNEGGRKKYISTEMSENKGQNDRLYDELRGIEIRIESFFNRVSHLLKDRTSRKYDRYHISGSFIVK